MPNGGFGDVDSDWAAFEQDNPSWFLCGLDALRAVCDEGQPFTSHQVWQRWHGHGPEPDEARNMARVMREGRTLGWCRIVGSTADHKRRDGHAGLGHVYEPLPPFGDAAAQITGATPVDDYPSRSYNERTPRRCERPGSRPNLS